MKSVTKYDEVVSREYAIAHWRAQGITWPRIAEEFSNQGVAVTAAHLRQYWKRRHGNKLPQVIVVELDTASLRANFAQVSAQLEEAQREVSAAREGRAKLLGELQAQRATVSQLNVDKAVAMAEIESLKRQLADVTPSLVAAQRDLVAWRGWAEEMSAAFRAQDWTTLNSALADLANRFPGPGAS